MSIKFGEFDVPSMGIHVHSAEEGERIREWFSSRMSLEEAWRGSEEYPYMYFHYFGSEGLGLDTSSVRVRGYKFIEYNDFWKMIQE